MRSALTDLRVEGVSTTAPFHLAVMEEREFRSGEFSIQYVNEHPELSTHTGEIDREIAIVAALFFEEAAGPGRTPGA